MFLSITDFLRNSTISSADGTSMFSVCVTIYREDMDETFEAVMNTASEEGA